MGAAAVFALVRKTIRIKFAIRSKMVHAASAFARANSRGAARNHPSLGEFMTRPPNYKQEKKRREEAQKRRNEQEQQRKAARKSNPPAQQ